MFCFEKISIEQILALSEILNTASLLNKDITKKRFLRRATNFDETVKFFKELGLIICETNNIVLTDNYSVFKDIRSSRKEAISKLILSCLLKNKTPFSEYLNEFLSHFVLLDDSYQFAPSTFQRLHYSELRNFLIDLGLIHLSPNDTKYVIASEYRSMAEEFIEKQKLSDDDFFKIQCQWKEIGDAAELKIIEYERHRLAKYPHLVESIEHTAKYNVKAGYDIKSYEEFDQIGNLVPRYIEVKAVSFICYQFYWSRNEIEKSEFYRHKYYLYLLPVKGKNEFDIDNLKMINDPFVNVFRNRNKWTQTCESLAFSLIAEIENKDKNKS